MENPRKHFIVDTLKNTMEIKYYDENGELEEDEIESLMIQQ